MPINRIRKTISIVLAIFLLLNSLAPYLIFPGVLAQETQAQDEPQSPEVTQPQDSNASTTSEPSVTVEPQPTEAPSSPTLDQVLVPPTEDIVPLTDKLDEPQNNSPPVSDDSASLSTTVIEAPSKWTFEKVELGKEYVAPQNEKVKLTFTKLPSPAGNIKIDEITLTEDQIKQTGSLSDKAYDITSDMIDGDFTYNLSLPIPDASKGKDVEVKFAEELSKIGSANKVENNVTKTETSVSVASLTHFTVFIITDDIANFTGSWFDFPTQGHNDGGVHFSTTVATGDTATWNFSSITGVRKVYISWSTDPNRSTATPYVLNHVGGPEPFTINQELLADQTTTGASGEWSGWHYVDTVTIDGSSNLVLTGVNNASGVDYVIADEVALVSTDEVWVDDNWVATVPGVEVEPGKIFSGNAFATVQDGINAVDAGGTVNVAAGTYIEAGQIVINKNLMMVGADKTTTIIKPAQDTGSVDDSKGWFLVNSGKTFNIKNVTLDGTGYKIYQGLRHNGSGVVDNVKFTNIKFEESGPAYKGNGIRIGGTGNVDVTNSEFDQIGRVGVLAESAATGTYSNNTYTGKGAGNWLDYGFDIEYGARVTIDNNTVSNNTGVATVDGSDSAAISVWDDAGTQAIITNNTLTNNHIGVAVAVINGGASDPTITIGGGNIFNAGDIGVDLENVGATGNPSVTFGTSTFKGFVGPTTQAIKIADGISFGDTFDISSVIFKDSSDVVITASSEIEDLVYHLTDASNRGLLKWDYVAPAVPTHVSPSDNSFFTTAGLAQIDWSDVTDSVSSPVSYTYQSSTSSATNPDGSFVSPAYTSGPLGVSQISTAGTPEGVYYWHVRASDSLGNTSAWSTAWKVTVDNTNPSTPGAPSTTTPTNSTTQTWTWTAATDSLSGIASYAWRVVGGTSGTVLGTTTTKVTNLLEGIWDFFVKAIDNAGNESAETSGSVTVDTTKPLISGSASPAANSNGWNNSDVVVSFTCADTGSTQSGIATNTVAGATLSSNGASQSVTNSGACIDGAGNSAVTASVTGISIDKTAPTEPTASPAAGSYTTDQLVTLVSTDALSTVDKIYYTTNGSTPDNTSTEYTGAITADHDMTIKAIAYDKAGNTSSVLSAVYEIAPTILTEGLLPTGPNAGLVFWTTDEASTSRVVYDTVSHPVLGSAPNYGYAYSTVEQDSSPKVTYHLVKISDLNNDTVYYYRVISHGSPDQVGVERNFKTNSPAPTTASSGGAGAPAGGTSGGTAIATGSVLAASTATNEEEVLGTTDEEGSSKSAELKGDVKGESTDVDYLNMNFGNKSVFKSPYLYGLLGAILLIIFFILGKKKKKKKNN